MSIYKKIPQENTPIKPTNVGVQKDDPQSLIDYLAGFNGDKFQFAAGEYDAVKGFFVNKGFSNLSAESLAYILLRQSRIDNVPVFQIIDSLNNTTVIELNELLAEIINLNRFKSSVLGFKSDRETTGQIQRNIKV
jgi:hypothetical protein